MRRAVSASPFPLHPFSKQCVEIVLFALPPCGKSTVQNGGGIQGLLFLLFLPACLFFFFQACSSVSSSTPPLLTEISPFFLPPSPPPPSDGSGKEMSFPGHARRIVACPCLFLFQFCSSITHHTMSCPFSPFSSSFSMDRKIQMIRRDET